MRIVGWHIDGYGIHHDAGVEALPDGLTIVGGPNEAGKTTLQHFLVGMLFGFTASNRPDHHAPLRGGSYGGRLFVTATDGTPFTIHRGARRSSLQIIGPDGPVTDPELELRHLLGGATKDLFEAVFAVHTDDLAELRALSDEQVRDRVFSAGILGAGRTAQAALGQLAGERDVLLKPGGRTDKYVLKRLRRELVDARGELAEARRAATGLPSLVHRIAVLETDRQRERTLRSELQTDRSLLFAVTEQWPAWADAAVARGELDQLGTVEPIPADAAARLDHAVARQLDLRTLADETADQVAQLTGAADAVERPGPALAHAEAITELAAALPAEREREVAISELSARVDALEAQLAAALGPHHDEAWLAAQPDTATTGSSMRAAAAALVAADQQLRQVHDHHRRSLAELHDARAEQTAREQILDGQPNHPVDRAQQAAEDAAALVIVLGQREAAAHRTLEPRPTTTPAVTAASLLLLLAAAVALASGTPIVAAIAAAAAMVLGAAALRTRRAPAAPEAPPATHDGDIDLLLRSLGLETCPTLAEAGTLRTRAEHLAAEATRLQREREAAAQQRRALDERAVRVAERHAADLAAADAAHTDAQAAWRTWLTSNGLSTDLDPPAAADVLEAVGRARALHHGLLGARHDLERSRTQHHAYRDAVADLLATSGLPTTSVDPLAAIGELATALQHDLEAARQLDAAQLELQAAQRHHDQAASRAISAAAEVDAVVAELGATTVDDARNRIERARRADDLRQRIQRAERDLSAAIGSVPERLATARSLLGQADPTRWRTELAALDRDLRAADERIDLITTELAHLQRERDELERSADVPAAELHVADLEAQLVTAVTRWASLTVAHQLVEGTLARYQRERQPDVVKRAATHFALVTGGRYPRLEVRDQTIVAIDHAQREIPADALSKGAIQQLYLCLRFALAESYARTAKLPLLLDDVTVHADDGRLPQLAEVVASVAADHQVLVFTCHDRTVELLQSACPEARLLTLDPSTPARHMGLAAG
jgi:uncharacterized protein YhaN